jgi:hypothetical protein
MSFIDKALSVVSKGTGGFFGLESALGAAGGGGGDGFDVQQASPYSIDTGAFSGSFKGGHLQGSMSGDMRQASQRNMYLSRRFGNEVLSSGQPYLTAGQGALSQLGSFDPFAAAEEQFGRLDAILEPGRNQARMGTAGGLLSTGRLGSTAGSRTQAEVEGEIERQRQGLLGEQFLGAQQTQQNLMQMATGLTQAGRGEQAAVQGMQTGALTNALNIDSQLQAALGLGSTVSKPEAVAQSQPGFGQQLTQGALTAGVGALIGLI